MKYLNYFPFTSPYFTAHSNPFVWSKNTVSPKDSCLIVPINELLYNSYNTNPLNEKN